MLLSHYSTYVERQLRFVTGDLCQCCTQRRGVCVVTVDGWTVDIVSLAVLGRSVCSNGVLVQNIAVAVA